MKDAKNAYYRVSLYDGSRARVLTTGDFFCVLNLGCGRLGAISCAELCMGASCTATHADTNEERMHRHALQRCIFSTSAARASAFPRKIMWTPRRKSAGRASRSASAQWGRGAAARFARNHERMLRLTPQRRTQQQSRLLLRASAQPRDRGGSLWLHVLPSHSSRRPPTES